VTTPAPIYTKDRLPEGEWRSYLNTVPRRMVAVEGPLVVKTREGIYRLGREWQGFIAVDSYGFPYPIAADEHARIYEEVAD
jgi:hypothetical protein